MSEATIEDIAETMFATATCGPMCAYDTVDPGRVDELCPYHFCVHQLRLAVSTQREKDASINPVSVACPECSAAINSICRCYHIMGWKSIGTHPERWRAAIRAGDPEDKERGSDDKD